MKCFDVMCDSAGRGQHLSQASPRPGRCEPALVPSGGTGRRASFRSCDRKVGSSSPLRAPSFQLLSGPLYYVCYDLPKLAPKSQRPALLDISQRLRRGFTSLTETLLLLPKKSYRPCASVIAIAVLTSTRRDKFVGLRAACRGIVTLSTGNKAESLLRQDRSGNSRRPTRAMPLRAEVQLPRSERNFKRWFIYSATCRACPKQIQRVALF